MCAAPLPQGFFDRPFAHRALHGPGQPENSREAILAAVDAGFAIEIDVQLSQDGVAMVFHDYGLTRLTGALGTVQKMEAAELEALPLLGGPTGAPTLSEALALVAGRVPMVIEIKDQDGAMGSAVGPLEEAVGRDVAGYAGPLAVMSFNPHSVAKMAELAPDLPRGLTTCAFEAEHWPTLPSKHRAELARLSDVARIGAAFISHDHRSLTMDPVQVLKRGGIPILTWTIRSAREAQKARATADQITFEHYLPA